MTIVDAISAVLVTKPIKDRIAEIGLTDLKVTASSVVTMDVHFSFKYKDYKSVLAATIPIGPFPGCCGINVIHNISVPGIYKWSTNIQKEPHGSCAHKGIGTLLVDIVTQAYELRGRTSGAGQLLAATNHVQTYGAAILLKLGWQPLSTFVNPNTKSTIVLWERVTSKLRLCPKNLPKGVRRIVHRRVAGRKTSS